MEYYSAINNDEILPFVTTWMDLEGIMLNEISQIEKNKKHIISLMCEISNTLVYEMGKEGHIHGDGRGLDFW